METVQINEVTDNQISKCIKDTDFLIQCSSINHESLLFRGYWELFVGSESDQAPLCSASV
jgi:hypothetical protein